VVSLSRLRFFSGLVGVITAFVFGVTRFCSWFEPSIETVARLVTLLYSYLVWPCLGFLPSFSVLESSGPVRAIPRLR
jgi:hypothetical protein